MRSVAMPEKSHGRSSESKMLSHYCHGTTSSAFLANGSTLLVAPHLSTYVELHITGRPGLCATKPGGDGGAVHAAGGALRAWQRTADEQPAVLGLGSDLQGSDDDGGGDRSAGPPQRDHRTEPAELPRGASQEGQARSSSRRERIGERTGAREAVGQERRRREGAGWIFGGIARVSDGGKRSPVTAVTEDRGVVPIGPPSAGLSLGRVASPQSPPPFHPARRG